MTAERKYQLTQLGPGDYVLPANDATTLFRLIRDENEGWSIGRWTRGMVAAATEEELLDWSNWRTISSHHKTRKAAIEEALS